MPDKPPDRLPATEIATAVKAKVEKLKEAQAQLEAKTKELEAERRKNDADRRELQKMEDALEKMKEDVDRRDDDLKAREGELDRGKRGLRETQEKLGAEDNRLKEWSKALQNTEDQVKALQSKSKAEYDEVAGKLAEVSAKANSLIEREELIASRETALAESLDRLSKMSEAISEREKALATQQEDLIHFQNERTTALRQREQELGATLDALSKRMREQETYTSAAAAMEQTLKQELAKLGSERQRLAAKERNLTEVEKSLSNALEAGGIDWETTPADLKETAVLSPAKDRPPVPEPPKYAPPPPPKQKESLEREFERAVAAATKVSKADAIDKMNRALEAAKQARDAGLDVTEVRRILKQARTAFEAQNWDEAAKLSDDILGKLGTDSTTH
jgi:chromosome segregation ATPase